MSDKKKVVIIADHDVSNHGFDPGGFDDRGMPTPSTENYNQGREHEIVTVIRAQLPDDVEVIKLDDAAQIISSLRKKGHDTEVVGAFADENVIASRTGASKASVTFNLMTKQDNQYGDQNAAYREAGSPPLVVYSNSEIDIPSPDVENGYKTISIDDMLSKQSAHLARVMEEMIARANGRGAATSREEQRRGGAPEGGLMR